MSRFFISFDKGVTDKEFIRLPEDDQAKLARAIKRYQDADETDIRPAVVQKYGEGLFSIKSQDPKSQGRALFSRVRGQDEAGRQVLVILLFYKKERDAVPRSVLETATLRIREYERRTGRELY